MGKSVGGAGVGSTLDDRTRDACLHSLGDQYAAGRLSARELESRIQAALAAETDADLAEVMADVPPAPSDEGSEEPRPGHTWERAGVVRWGIGLLVLAAGGVLLAVVGSGSDTVEFGVGLGVGLLGFLTHWWLSARSSRPADEAPTAVAPGAEDRPAAPVLRDEADEVDEVDETAGCDDLPVTVVEPPEPRPARPDRPLGRGDGGVPTQRAGD